MRLTFSAPLLAADAGRRIIAGRIVTFGETGHTSAGATVFEAGSIDFPEDVVLVLEHDTTRPLGRALELSETPDGIDATFRIAGTRRGDDALIEAAEALRDGFSVGVDVTAHSFDEDGTLRVTASKLDHVGLVTRPAIDSARVDRVAASQETQPEGNTMSDNDTVEVVEVVEVVDTVEAARPVIRTAPRVREYTNPADYIVDFVNASRGDREAGVRIAAANQGVAANPGIIPAPIVGNVIDVLDGSRPVVASSRSLPMPAAGTTFDRPIITTHTAAGEQSAEFAPLASRAMAITSLPVTKETYGGFVGVSFQNRDWTDPAVLSMIVGDLAKSYAIQTEQATATAFQTAVTAEAAIGATPDAESFIKGIYSAAAAVSTAVGDLPDTLWVAPDAWATIGSLVDAAKRPLFPSMGPVNAGGVLSPTSYSGNPLGLNLVVASHLLPGSMIVGRSEYLETYENVGGNLSATNVTTLSFDVAYYGYFAKLVTVPAAFVNLVDTVTPLAAKSAK